jgi:hypothetical protein
MFAASNSENGPTLNQTPRIGPMPGPRRARREEIETQSAENERA